MNKRSIELIWVSGVAVAGLTFGWLIQGGTAAVNSPPFAGLHHKSERGQDTPNSTLKTNEKWQAFAAGVCTSHPEEREAITETIAPEDRRAAIEALLAEGGPAGFDRHLEQVIDQLLAAWAEENFEAAWDWGQQLNGEGSQNFIAEKLLNRMVTTDPELALTRYLELLQTNPSLKSNVPERILANASLKTADDFLKCAGEFKFGWNPGAACEFARDFNFQQVADEVGKLPNKEDRKIPAGFPQNFYDVWAERDREAAFASFVEGKLDRLGGLHSFLAGLGTHHKPEEIWDWVASKIQDSEASNKLICSDLHYLGPMNFNGIVQALPDAASRDRFLLQVALEGSVAFRGNEVPSIAISAMSSPQVRLESFSQMHQDRMKNERKPLDITKVTDADLQAWGITHQQLVTILSSPKKETPNSN
jgi:hypothetical protein